MHMARMPHNSSLSSYPTVASLYELEDGGDETKAHLYLMSKVSSSVIKHHPSQMTAPLVLLQRQFLMHTKISPRKEISRRVVALRSPTPVFSLDL